MTGKRRRKNSASLILKKQNFFNWHRFKKHRTKGTEIVAYFSISIFQRSEAAEYGKPSGHPELTRLLPFLSEPLNCSRDTLLRPTGLTGRASVFAVAVLTFCVLRNWKLKTVLTYRNRKGPTFWRSALKIIQFNLLPLTPPAFMKRDNLTLK